MAEKKKHPLEHPFDTTVENDGLAIDIVESSIGIHDFKLSFRDAKTNEPVGYGWFNADLAAKLLGSPLPKNTPKRGVPDPPLNPASVGANLTGAPPAEPGEVTAGKK